MVVVDSESATILRVKGLLEFRCQLDSTDEQLVRNAISRTFETLRSQVKSESCVLAVSDSPVIIWPNKDAYATPEEITPSTPCEDMHQWIQADEQETSGKKSSKKKSKKSSLASVINLRLMTEVTKPGPLSAPILTKTVLKSHFVSVTLPLDCVVRTGSSDTIKDACEQLIEALTHQLCEMEKVTLQNMKGMTLLVPEPVHFLLPEPKGLVTVVYPAGVPDSQLVTQRKELHQQFDLPDDRPYFRRANAYHFPNEPYKDGYLRNPHLALTHPTLDNGKVYLVQGIYSYHHYMQNRVDDNGWGCAYRSLQTICSWFRQQGYVERPVPTHKEIQQALVDVGDKQASFVGSRQWIGSIEVQAVLSHLLGLTSKILFVSQGAELASKGRELANHFLTEGTPVMIGGGVLAHTILGVAWSETTGQIRYLILDPHYTGAEDLQVITDKVCRGEIAMFNPSELEGEVDHSFFDSDCAESSANAEHKVEKGLKAEKKISEAHDKLHAKHRENYHGDLSSRTDQTRKHLKQAETSNRSSRSSFSSTSDKVSSESSDSEDCTNLQPKRSSRTFMALLAKAKEVDNTDVYIQSPKETKGEALPFSASSDRRNKQSSKKVIRNLRNQSPSAPLRRSESPSLSSTETSADADSEGSYSSSSHQSSLESPAPPKPSATSSSCPGIRRTRVGSARPRDLPVLHTADSDDTVTDVTPLSSPDTSPLQSLDLNVTEVEEESHKEEQARESVPSSGLRNIQDDDSDQDVDECSLNLESQLGRKLVFHYPGGRNRKNYPFSNEEVRRIDLENQRLLRELSRLSPGPRLGSAPVKKSHGASNSPRIRLTHSAVNRQREQQRIERENLAFLKRLESVKPTPGLRRSEQLTDYQRQAGYLGGSSYPICRSTTKKDRSSSRTTSAGPRSVNSRASLPSSDSSSRPSPRSKKPVAARAAWC